LDTIYLSPDGWDWVLDANGDIAVASDPYSLAQDAASAIRAFEGECWYDTALGVPYWQQILGQLPPLSLVRAQMIAAAMTVPEVVSAQVFFTGFVNRVLSGQVQITTADGTTAAATI